MTSLFYGLTHPVCPQGYCAHYTVGTGLKSANKRLNNMATNLSEISPRNENRLNEAKIAKSCKSEVE